MGCFGQWRARRKTRRNSSKRSSEWRIFTLKELQSATNNFNYDNKLGEGGFGSVYWGQLWDGSQIAVKRLKVWSIHAELEFSVEIEILGRVRHKNLLNLRGYCSEGHERLIVYDYMTNLSLHSHLHGQCSSDTFLDWNRRMKIAIGSAEGIAYLHHHATPRIIHRNIKASNVLLNSSFEAQVADFGFVKLIPDDVNHPTTNLETTVGYLAPEYMTTGKASESCDVYSFGIVLLELVTGKKPVVKRTRGVNTSKQSIVDWYIPLLEAGKIEHLADPKLKGRYNEEEFMRVLHIARNCAQHPPEKRPSMLEVVDLLKGITKDDEAAADNHRTLELKMHTDHSHLRKSSDDSKGLW